VRLFVVDEMDKVECLSQGFVDAVRTLLAPEQPLVATITLREDGLIAEVKCDPRARASWSWRTAIGTIRVRRSRTGCR